MDEEVYNKDEWRELKEGKPGKILGRISRIPTIGYFRPGPTLLNANDFLVSQIGQHLNLQVPKVQFLEFAEVKGSVSFLVASEPQPWSSFPFKNQPEEHLSDPQDLAATAVFDTWIYNEDRNQENFLYAKNPKTGKYDVWLIDNTHTLCGPSVPPFHDASRFILSELIKIDEIRHVFSSGIEPFLPMIERIEKLDNDIMRQAIEAVPPEFIAEDVRKETYKLLESRKKVLKDKITEICSSLK